MINEGFVDNTGKEVIPLSYQYAGSFSEGLAAVEKDGKFGFIDNTGKEVIPFQYDIAYNFENGKAQATFGDDGKTPAYFYIDKTGKILTHRTSLTEFYKKLEQGDDVSFWNDGSSKQAMVIEIKGNLVQIQTKERYSETKWVKKSEVYPANHFDY